MEVNPHDDPEIMLRFKSGDAYAFKQLHDKHYLALLYFARGIIRNEEDAKDLIAEAFAKLWKRHTLFETNLNVKAFLYITVRNDCISYLRKKQKESLLQLSNTAQENPLELLAKAELLAELYQVIETLPSSQKQVLKLFMEGLTTSEIAAKLQFQESSVRAIKTRAIVHIRNYLKKEYKFSVLLGLLLPIGL